MRILFAENDDEHYAAAVKGLSRLLTAATFERVKSESSFLEWLKQVGSGDHPLVDAIVLDWRLPWSSVIDEIFRRPDDREIGADFAGLRCLKALENSVIWHTRVVVYTALGVWDIKPELQVLQTKPPVLEKGHAAELAKLLLVPLASQATSSSW